MSDIVNVQNAIPQIWDADHLVRDESGRDPLGYVHPDHIIFKAKTIRVGSLPEMRLPRYAALELANVFRVSPDILYSSFSSLPKPNVDVRVGQPVQFFLRLAATTTVPSEYVSDEAFIRQAEGLLWRKIDAVEAFSWFTYMVNATYFMTLSPGIGSYREVFSFGRVFLARLSPQNEIDVMVTPRAFGAILLENRSGTSDSLSLTEHHVASGYLNIIPVAMRYGGVPNGVYTQDLVCMYPRVLAERTKRYVFEAAFFNRVIDSPDDRNLKRLTCERYVAAHIPMEHFIAGIPYTTGITFNASQVTSAISTKYSAATLTDLNNAATIA